MAGYGRRRSDVHVRLLHRDLGDDPGAHRPRRGAARDERPVRLPHRHVRVEGDYYRVAGDGLRVRAAWDAAAEGGLSKRGLMPCNTADVLRTPSLDLEREAGLARGLRSERTSNGHSQEHDL